MVSLRAAAEARQCLVLLDLAAMHPVRPVRTNRRRQSLLYRIESHPLRLAHPFHLLRPIHRCDASYVYLRDRRYRTIERQMTRIARQRHLQPHRGDGRARWTNYQPTSCQLFAHTHRMRVY